MKKILSFILAFVMIFSILPTSAFAVVNVAPLSVTYKFFNTNNSDAHSDVGTTGYLEQKLGTKRLTDYPAQGSASDRAWGYLGTSSANSYGSTNYFAVISPDCTTVASPNANEWLAFKVKVPASGIYELSGTAGFYKSAAEDMEIYVVPLTAELSETLAGSYGTISATNSTPKYKREGAKDFTQLGITASQLGSVDLDDDAKGSVEILPIDTTYFSDISLDANKDYALIFNSKSGGAMRVSSLTLTMKESAASLGGVLLVLGENEVRAGKTTPAVIKVTDENGGVYPDAYTVEYTVTDTSVAEIDAENGIITAKEEGITDITVKVTSGDVSVSDTKTLTVIPAPAPGNYMYNITTNALLPTSGLIDASAGVVLGNSIERVKSDKLKSTTDAYTIDAIYCCDENADTGKSYINADYMRLRLYVAYYTPANGHGEERRPHAAIRLEDVEPGTYRLSVTNNASTSTGAHTKVYFGEAPDIYKTEDVPALREEYSFLGWHISTTAHKGTEESPAETFEVNVPEKGDYYVLFVADHDSYERNNKISSSRQIFYLSGIALEKITPIGSTELNLERMSVAAPRITTASVTPFDINGNLFVGNYSVRYESSNPEFAEINETTGEITPKSPGETTITAYVVATTDNITVEDSKVLTVTPQAELEEIADVTSGGSKHIRLTKKEVQDTPPLYVTAIGNDGKVIDQSLLNISARSLTPEIAEIDSSLCIVPKAEGEAQLEVTVNLRDITLTKTAPLTVVYAKGNSTYMTEEEALNARENISKFSWAKSSANGYIKAADKWSIVLDTLYDHVIAEGIPRKEEVGHSEDIYVYYCRYCGCDIRAEYGTYAWLLDPLSRPWKIQCPDCKRLFPSNDFESLYKLGLNEYGEYDRIRALEAHREMLIQNGEMDDVTVTDPGEEYSAEWLRYYGYGKGYLKNTTYNELYNGGDMDGIDPFFRNADLDGDKKADNAEVPIVGGYEDVKSGMLWGVDDGYGYLPLNEKGEPRYALDANGNPYKDDNGNIIYERHAYIAFYVHTAVWYSFTSGVGGIIEDAINESAHAYFYTGEPKYGRVAAILLDRVADVFPGLDYGKWNYLFGNPEGKGTDRIWSNNKVTELITAYDMVYDVFDDPYVVNYINEKSKTLKMRHSKKSADQIRTNIEDGILRCALDAIKKRQINGNFGMDQKTLTAAAVVLDSMPETANWLDFLIQTGWNYADGVALGGGVNERLMDQVDADGLGTEGSTYNVNWLRNLISVNECLEDYDKYQVVNLFKNPKFVQMYYSFHPLIASNYSPNIGDSGSTAGTGHWISSDIALSGWQNLGDPFFAQMLYFLNGNSAKGIRYGITEKDPERLENEVQSVIDTYGEYDFKSDILPNFGFAMLRDGKDFTSGTNTSTKDTRRNVWMYFGTNAGHAHFDTLNLGMTAFGLNFMPDLGYPEQTGDQPNRLQWVETTFSHNAVIVENVGQSGNPEVRGKAKHFDDDGTVALMDVSGKNVYATRVDDYRRSVVQIHVDDENSYMVDFFRVLGGSSHTYSLHASSNEIAETVGLTLDPQDGTPGDYTLDENGYLGSYAGPDVPYGEAPSGVQRGHSWVKNIDRDVAPDDKIEVNFAIKDFNKAIKDSSGLHLYMTMLNGGNMKDGVDSDVVIADGLPPQKEANKNIDKLKYVFVENKGENLDTVFTTVFEPYRDDRFITSVDELEMKIIDAGTPGSGDAARAVKVTHKNGRVDYIFYSTNNTVTHEVTASNGEKIFFRGFVGVYTIQNGENTYSYVHDGDIIGKPIENAKGAIEGEVVSFTKEHLEENEIVIAPANGAVTEEELGSLAGRLVVVDNGDLNRGGAFKIEGAYRIENSDNIRLDIGRITTIRKYADAYDFDAGYIYLIAEGQNARIPLSTSDDSSPVFDEINSGLSTSAGSSISVTVNAESPIENNPPKITYIGATLPRGASINADTGTVTWKPDASQVGENHFAVTARDEDGRESTTHFTVTVYGSTTSNKNETAETPSGGGGGGGGGAAPAPDNTDIPTEKEPETGENSPDASGETDVIRFTDIQNHSWAADAINELAADGIIKGTSASTFSPASNITRADFALLLVRAFKLESANTENFADVSASDYFASELAIARNTGIVGGIGDNKFAPKSKITRQDMMVIVYRALEASLALKGGGTEGDGGIFLSQYPDFANVAPYARDAVSALISAGLVNGKNGSIAPTVYTTRAEVAVLIKRILDYVE